MELLFSMLANKVFVESFQNKAQNCIYHVYHVSCIMWTSQQAWQWKSLWKMLRLKILSLITRLHYHSCAQYNVTSEENMTILLTCCKTKSEGLFFIFSTIRNWNVLPQQGQCVIRRFFLIRGWFQSLSSVSFCCCFVLRNEFCVLMWSCHSAVMLAVPFLFRIMALGDRVQLFKPWAT